MKMLQRLQKHLLSPSLGKDNNEKEAHTVRTSSQQHARKYTGSGFTVPDVKSPHNHVSTPCTLCLPIKLY